MKQLVLIGLLLLPLLGLAQSDFQWGRLITVEGDTLDGYLARATGDQFVYKKEKNGTRSFIKEDDLASYRLGDDTYEKHLVDVQMGKFPERREVYLKVLVDGPVRLMEYTGTGMLGASHTNHFLFHDDASMPWLVPSQPRAFRNQVGMYFGDCEDVHGKIRQQEMGYDELNAIVILYNTWAISDALEHRDVPE